MTFLPIHQRRIFNKAWHRTLVLIALLLPIAATAADVVQISQNCKHHAGAFPTGFSDDFDIDRTVCPIIPGKLSFVRTVNGIHFEFE